MVLPKVAKKSINSSALFNAASGESERELLSLLGTLFFTTFKVATISLAILKLVWKILSFFHEEIRCVTCLFRHLYLLCRSTFKRSRFRIIWTVFLDAMTSRTCAPFQGAVGRRISLVAAGA